MSNIKYSIKCVFLLICILSLNLTVAVGLFKFAKESQQLSEKDRNLLNSITPEQWIKSINFGVESVEKRKRLEGILLSSKINIRNGSISHTQLLDTLPNKRAQHDSDIATKILKSSLHVYHTICLEKGIGAEKCSQLLENMPLPKETNLSQKCKEITQSRRDGHHAFRRLLPRHYMDSFYEMYSESANLPSPRLVSMMALPDYDINFPFEEEQRNLALVQWAQFIEHDLSKPVVMSMSNGEPIECCNKDNLNLSPRYRHTACAPLLFKNASDPVSCLNYVRSALAVGESCTFGAAEQLNQATGYFDLSQLYGFTKTSELKMRAFKDGKIKSSQATKINQDLLPMATEESHDFCAFKANNSSDAATCFMAGDSRVNSNPFAITIYTIFLRNHNRIAKTLKMKHPHWDDEQTYQTAKAVNIDSYRQIVYKEWLPEVLGHELAKKINNEIFEPQQAAIKNDAAFRISNEFAVAAIRFYYSMMPDALNDLAMIDKNDDNDDDYITKVHNNDILPHAQIFTLRDQWYTPKLMYSARKLDQILQSIMQQRAMKMDATYVSSLIPDAMGNTHPTHANILASDIQRGRDHGLQPYYKYLEICKNLKIKDWSDLEMFISKEEIRELKSVYGNWTDIDLIVGGIAEIPKEDSTVGPTFTCILGEQFSKIRQWQHLMGPNEFGEGFVDQFNPITAADLLCANSGLKQVTQNIFRLPSKNNPMASCAERTEIQRK